jgi:dienelactone hydrolase
MRVAMRALPALFALFTCVSGTSALAETPELDASLRESVERLPVPGTGATIVMTSYRPPGDGPFPWIVLSHGTAVTSAESRAMGRARNPRLVHEWVRRGYAVLVPVRRGYGESGGEREADSYGSCAHADFRAAGESAALDLLATVNWGRTQRDLDADRWMLVGQSAGAFASIYTASKAPPGLVAVLAFSPGRGGDPQTRPGEPCASDRMAVLFASIAPRIPVPVLWFYAENDQFFGRRVQQLWFDRFQSAGGRGELVVVPPFPERLGHGVFPSAAGTPLWTEAVSAFFKTEGIGLPF